MVYAKQAIFLFVVTQICAINFATEHKLPKKDIKAPLHESKNTEIVNTEETDKPVEKNLPQKNQLSIFSEEEVAEMEFVFENSPKKAQYIVNHLQDPTYFPLNENYRSAIFVGEPGTDKYRMANAIAYKMIQKGWTYKNLSRKSLTESFYKRSETTSKLKRELQKSIASGEPTIIVIDELDHLFQSKNRYDDSNPNATALWNFLDAQKGNNKFFLIGVMNHPDKLPKAHKNKILFNSIYFPTVEDPHIKCQTLRTIFENKNIKIDSEVTDEFLMQELRTANCMRHDLHSLAIDICKITKMNNPEISDNMIIKKASISQAINELVHMKALLKYDFKNETLEQRQERHHQEYMDLQKKFHDEQKLLDKEARKEKLKQFEEAMINISSLR